MASKDVAIFIKAFDRASKTLDQIDRTGTKMFKALSVAAGATIVAFTALGVAYSRLITSGVLYNAELEKYEAILTGVFKSQKRARKEMKLAIEFAAKTPFEIPQIAEATARLESFGISARKWLPLLGNLAASKTKELNQAVEAFVDAQVGEFERLKEFGITKELLLPLGLQLDAKGTVTDLESIGNAMEKLIQQKMGTAMLELSKTFIGMSSNLKDVWSSVLGVLSKPAFEQIKVEMRRVLDAIDALKKSGRLAEVLEGWAEAGRVMIKVISELVVAVGDDFLKAVKRAGNAVLEFVKNIDVVQLKALADRIIEVAKGFGKFAVALGKAFNFWKLFIDLGIVLVLTKVGKSIITVVTAAGKLVRALKLAAITLGAAGVASGAGLLAGLTALVLIIHRLSTASDRARDKIRKLAQEQRELGFTFIDIAKGSKAAIASMRILISDAEEQRQKVSQLEAQIVKEQARVLSTVDKIFRGGKDVVKVRIREMNKELKATKKLLGELDAQIKEALPIKEADKFIARIGEGIKTLLTPEVDTKKVKAEAKIIRELREELALELDKLTKSDTDFRIDEVGRWAKAKRKIAKGDLGIIDQINRAAQLKIDAIKDEGAKKEAKRIANRLALIQSVAQAEVDAIQSAMALFDTDRQARERAVEEQAKQIQLTLGAVKANEFRLKKAAEFRQEDLDKESQAFTEKMTLDDRLMIMTLEAQGNMRKATEERLRLQLAALRAEGAEENQLTAFIAARNAQIREQFGGEAEGKVKQRLERIAMATIASQEQLSEQLDSLRESDFEKEQERIRGLSSEYGRYINSALDLSSALFNAQDQGFLKTLANIIRIATRTVAFFLRNKALEKLKQADEKKGAAGFLKAHISRLAALSAEAIVLGAIALGIGLLWGDPKAFAAAKAFGSAVTMSTTAIGAAKAEMVAFNLEAVKLQTEAAGLMTAAIATETAGEVLARGAEAQARSLTEQTREAERRARAEEQLRRDIARLEGQTQVAEALDIQRRVEQFREAGVETGLLERFQQLRLAEAGLESAQVVNGLPITLPTPSQPSTVVTQTIVFQDLFDSASDEQLREWAELLVPYIEEIEDKSG